MIKELKKINFPTIYIFSNINIAYLDLVGKILNIVYKIAPFKDLRIKKTLRIGSMTKSLKLKNLGKNVVSSSNQKSCILMKTYIKKLNIM